MEENKQIEWVESEQQWIVWDEAQMALGFYDTYGEADALRTELQSTEGNSDLEIKIRRCGPEGTQFKIKTHRPKTNK